MTKLKLVQNERSEDDKFIVTQHGKIDPYWHCTKYQSLLKLSASA